MFLAVSTQTSVGWVLVFIALLVAIVFAFANVRQGKAEVGSEVELAPNRRPYLSDAELEGPKLDRTLSMGLLGLAIIGLGLPLYWLQEPARQANEVGNIQRKFIDRGAEMFAPTADGGFNCAFCHGADGGGGAAPQTITDAEGRFVKQVTWRGPALDTVLMRYTRDEVRYVLTYGRPFSPMPAWGVKGGGPLTDQQLQNLIDYIGTLQITPAESQKAVDEELDLAMKAPDLECQATKVAEAKVGLSGDDLQNFDETTVDTSSCPRQWKSKGVALFNLGYTSGFKGGAYSCGRCHTAGWSYGEKVADGTGAMGPNLTAVTTQFPGGSMGVQQQVDFVCTGSVDGARYGQNGQGTGRMPGFCIVPEVKLNADNHEVGITPRDSGTAEEGAMYTEQQVRLIVEYERSLAR